MKRFLVPLVCLGAGIGIGYYFGYSRPAMRMYRGMQENLGLSAAGMAKQAAEGVAALQRNGEGAALVGLGVIKMLDRGEIGPARWYCAYSVGDYYQHYRASGDKELVAEIERMSVTNGELAVSMTNLAATRAGLRESRKK